MLDRTPCVLVPELHLPSVPLDGFLVARQPYPGVSIEEALQLAQEHGCVMPTKRLVDALYTQRSRVHERVRSERSCRRARNLRVARQPRQADPRCKL